MTETSASPTRSVVIERDMPHPPEKVWRALTTQPLIEDWLMANDFEAKVGHRFTLRTQPVGGWNGIIDCEVLAVEPPERLSYTWASMGLESVVTFTLAPTASGARLRMEQSGFPADAEQNLRGAEWGWNKFLGQLEQVLARA
jgi:uncharacterized protein YndB with AHSA1/START domain